MTRALPSAIPSGAIRLCVFCLSCIFGVLSVGALAGCGRKATEADCAMILDRNVEVQMKAMNIGDPTAIEKRKEEIRGAMKGEVKECVGKRITDAMVACVQKAQTADEIDRCMR